MTTRTDTRAVAAERSDRLRHLIDDPSAPDRQHLRVLTGDRPTGHLHIGHYLASVCNRVLLQNKGIDTLVLVADYQVITDRDSAGRIDEYIVSLVTDYLAAGLDASRSTIFAHSAVPELNQLMLPFLSLVTDAELRRNPTVKDELAATDGRPLSGLLLTYPVHQAADILFCHATVVPAGADQLPHVEQTRSIARRFNRRYAGGQQVFAEPDALLSETTMLLGLDGAKMSKTRRNTIPLRADADETAALIRSARTDSQRRITFDPSARPEVANLLTIGASFRGIRPEELAAQIGDGGAIELKRQVIEAVNDGLAEHRRRRRELESDPAYVRAVLQEGNARAREVAVLVDRALGDGHGGLSSDYRGIVPPDRVLDLFAVPGDTRPLPGGQGQSVLAGDLVLSPGRDSRTADLISPVLARLAVEMDTRSGRRRHDLRVAVPVPARDGSWTVDGWAASRYETGTRACHDLPVIRAAGAVLHAELAQAVRAWPAADEEPRHRWARAERMAFGGDDPAMSGFSPQVRELARKLLAERTDDPLGPRQLVHGDLAGNVLLDEAGAPVVIDVAPYWRPVLWADAVCVLDAVLWHKADAEALEDWTIGAHRQAMLRAGLYRLLADDPEDVEPYRRALAVR